jgi:fructose-1,6-bisphosphatase
MQREDLSLERALNVLRIIDEASTEIELESQKEVANIINEALKTQKTKKNKKRKSEGNTDGDNKRKKTVYTEEQKAELINSANVDPYPSDEEKQHLVMATGLELWQIESCK